MIEKIITKELAKLYEKQGYLEDSLACYIDLYDKTKDQEFADAIEKIKNKISPSDDKEKGSDTKLQQPSDLEENEDKSKKTLALFEEWLNMIVLEKKIKSFKKIQLKHE